MKSHWEERYKHSEYAYGKEPNAWLASVLPGYTPGKIVFPAEGEGRNAVYAATLGWEVQALDQSEAGRVKALALADHFSTQIQYQVVDAGEAHFPAHYFDAIALIYAHFPAHLRRTLHPKWAESLKPGGLLILEAFSIHHPEFQKINPKVGGPSDPDFLYSVEDMIADFPGFNFTTLKEEVIVLNEGRFHQGSASVIRCEAIKNDIG
jgi:SAM-dependent methyltransferase